VNLPGGLELKRANLNAEIPTYNEIPLSKIMDVLTVTSTNSNTMGSATMNNNNNRDSALRDYMEIKIILGRNYQELSNIFRHYSSLSFTSSNDVRPSSAHLTFTSNSTSSINFTEFLVFIQDCHLLNKKLTKGILHLIFTRCTVTLKQLSESSIHALPYTDADRLEQAVIGGQIGDGDTIVGATQKENSSSSSRPSSSHNRTSSSSVDKVGRHVLHPPDFFESLIRIGLLKYSNVGHLPERVRRLIEIDILPHACRLKMDEFRSLLNRDRVKHVLKTHAQELSAIFYQYAKEETNYSAAGPVGNKKRTDKDDGGDLSASSSSSMSKGGKKMSRSGFLRFAQEAHLLTAAPGGAASMDTKEHALSLRGPSTPFSAPSSSASSSASSSNPYVHAASAIPFYEHHLLGIFMKVLRLPDLPSTNVTNPNSSAASSSSLRSAPPLPVPSDLSYSEFLECLGAISAFKFPDPYLPIQVKLETFITHVLLPPMKKIIRRLNMKNNSNTSTTTTSAAIPTSSGLSGSNL